jgi:hypothetical protein
MQVSEIAHRIPDVVWVRVDVELITNGRHLLINRVLSKLSVKRTSAAAGSAAAAVCLDPIAIRIDHEARIIIGAIVGAHAGRAVVAAARSERRRMERIYAPRVGALKQKCRPDVSSGATGRSVVLIQNATASRP